MTPPRIQCLNVARNVTKKGSNLRATFSTSQIERAGDTPNRSSSSIFLAGLGEASSASNTKPPGSSSPNQSSSGQTPSFRGLTSPRPRDRSSSNANPIADPRERKGTNTRSVIDLVRGAEERRARLKAQDAAASATPNSIASHFLAQDYSRQITRRWRAGDVYAPHDLSGVEMKKWKKRSAPTKDVFDVLGFNPEQHYRNFAIMSEYMTPMGRIKHSSETGLRPVNQRRIARAIRRSIGLGLMPSVHRHPEVLYPLMQRNQRDTPSRFSAIGVAPKV